MTSNPWSSTSPSAVAASHDPDKRFVDELSVRAVSSQHCWVNMKEAASLRATLIGGIAHLDGGAREGSKV
jgi:hypothetical protein